MTKNTRMENQIIEILTNHPPTLNLWTDPIYAVDKAIGWSTDETTKCVTDLLRRGKLITHTDGVNRREDPVAPSALWRWKRH